MNLTVFFGGSAEPHDSAVRLPRVHTGNGGTVLAGCLCIVKEPVAFDFMPAGIAGIGIPVKHGFVHKNNLHIRIQNGNSFVDVIQYGQKNGILLAEKLGVRNVVCFSGCPGEPDGCKYPNWVTQPWPTEFEELYNWQWNEVLIPYWKEKAAFAAAHHVTVCIEMHPGFSVYNAETALKLYNAVNSEGLGITCDPSNIVWQGCNVPAAIHKLGGAIRHFHAKDSIEQMENFTGKKSFPLWLM